jgi:hypothetical protein
MSAVLMNTELTTTDCPTCGVAPEDINNLRAEIERLRAALHKIAFKPFGPADASATRMLLLITELARDTLTADQARARYVRAGRGDRESVR